MARLGRLRRAPLQARLSLESSAVLLAAALGLGLAVGWTMVVARSGPRGEMLMSLALIAAPLAVSFLITDLVPLVVVGVTAFNVVFAMFMVWGLSAEGTTKAGIAALAALGAWLAAAVGTAMLIRGAEPVLTPLVLLAVLPVVAALLHVRDMLMGRSSAEGTLLSAVWMFSMFLMPPLLVVWLIASR